MKTAFITGADQGIGYGFTLKLLEEGWQVFATSRKPLQDLPVHRNLEWIALELTDDISIQNAFSSVTGKADSIDLLVNNAGVNKDTVARNQKENRSFGFLR